MLYSKGGGLFDTLSGIYEGAKGVVKEAGITEIRAGGIAINLNPEEITTESNIAGKPSVSIMARPNVPKGYIFAGIGVVSLIVFLMMLNMRR